MRYCSLIFLLLTGCVGIPEGIEPVQNFEIKRYLGTWYEVARLDHSFERGLQQVTAEYQPSNDGGIQVINRGFDTASQAWNETEGKAYFVDDNTTGHLKVSFFGPFYSSYVIFGLGEDYGYSLVTGSNRSYLWLLSRTPTLDPALQDALIQGVSDLGFAAQDLIFVEQSIR